MITLLLALAVTGFVVYEVFNVASYNSDNWPPAPSESVKAFALAISAAENSGAQNNPGSLTAGDVPGEYITGTFNSAGVVNIDTLEHGVNALYAKIERIKSGQSSVFSLQLPILNFAALYTTGDANNTDSPEVQGYADSLAQSMGADQSDTLDEVLNNG